MTEMFSVDKSTLEGTALKGKDLIAMACFFASGFAGLAYEICWIRKASLVFGATTFAVSTVIGVFFAGLALGSYVFGRYSQRTLRPLKVYAVLEISLGGIALLNPALFYWADDFYGLFYPSMAHSFALLSFIRFIFIALLILPPTFLMGATLPLFCRQYVVNEKKISLSVGLLYGLNTLGAAIGCMACGFYLIPHLGVNKTIWLGAVLNILIGLTVGNMQITAVPSPTPTPKSAVDRKKSDSASMPGPIALHSPTHDVFTISALFFLAGFVALGNEILWTRYLSLIVHNTVYTYTLALTLTLIGIVLGSILIAGFTDRTYRRAFVFGSLHVLNGITILALLMLPADWWTGIIDTQNFSTQLWIFMLVLLLPAILSGMSFPLAIRMVVEHPSLAGIGVGKMTAINTFGGITGSLAVGFIVLPWTGLQKTLMLTTGLSLFIGITAWLLLDRTLRVPARITLVSLSLLLWVATPFITGTRLPADFLADRAELVDFREGLGSNMAVIKGENNSLTLEIDRMWQGANLKGYHMMLAHLPMLLHQDPKDVLVIGLGVGQTASRFLLYDVKHLDCVDIEGELFELVREHYDSAWMDDKRVSLIVEDGRNYLAHTRQKYDIISINIGQIFRPGAASFYTADFYRRARDRLNDHGIVCQSVLMSPSASDEFLSVIRSFLEVFPECALWYNGSCFLLIGSTADQLKFPSESRQILSANDEIHKDLRYAYWGGPAYWLNQWEIFLASFLIGPESLAELTAHAPVYRDDVPVLEYAAAKRRIDSKTLTIDLIRPYLDPVQSVQNDNLDDNTLLRIQSVREKNVRDIMAEFLYRRYRDEQDPSLLQNAIQWNPYNVYISVALGDAFIDRNQIQKAIHYYQTALDTDPENLSAHNNLGNALAMQGRIKEAARHFSEALRINPDFPEARRNLEHCLRLLNKSAGE
jgi:spermidine synthase